MSRQKIFFQEYKFCAAVHFRNIFLFEIDQPHVCMCLVSNLFVNFNETMQNVVLTKHDFVRPHIIFCGHIILCGIDIHIQKRNDKNWENYKKQGNFFVEILRKTKTI